MSTQLSACVIYESRWIMDITACLASYYGVPVVWLPRSTRHFKLLSREENAAILLSY
jgi:hypothetical protein